MKKILSALTLVAVFSACNNDSKTVKTDVVTLPDSAMYNNTLMSDTAASTVSNLPEPEVKPAPPVTKPPKKTTTTKTSTSTTAPAPESTTPTTTEPTTGTTPTATTQPEKKGMSNATKGAIIGGVGGAIGGAVISNKKGTGAIIGGIVGATGGYIIGKKKDKKAAAAADTTTKTP